MKKGFTLIELILVILLLGIIATISVPVVTGIISDAKEKSYNQQVNSILSSAQTYMTKNVSKLPKEDENVSSCISIEDMQRAGILESKDVKNPLYKENCEESLLKNSEKQKEGKTESEIIQIENDTLEKINLCKSESLTGVIYVRWSEDSNKYKYTYDNSVNVCP